MKALVFEEPRRAAVRELEVPTIAAGRGLLSAFAKRRDLPLRL